MASEISTAVLNRDFLLDCPPGGGRPMHAIAIEICQKHKVTLAELRSRRRDRPLAWARQEFWWRCKKETPASLPEMGRYLERDHTTAMHGIKAHAERMKKEGKGD